MSVPDDFDVPPAELVMRLSDPPTDAELMHTATECLYRSCLSVADKNSPEPWEFWMHLAQTFTAMRRFTLE